MESVGRDAYIQPKYMMYALQPSLSIFYNCIGLSNVDNIYRILLYCKKIQ